MKVQHQETMIIEGTSKEIMQQRNNLIKNGWYIFKFDPVLIEPNKYSATQFVLVASRHKITIDGKIINT